MSHILPELKFWGVQSEVAIFFQTKQQVKIPRDIPVRLFPGDHRCPREKSAWIRRISAGADLVHTHLNFSTLQTRQALKPTSIPLVTTLHNIWYGNAGIKTYPFPGRLKVMWMRWQEKKTLGPSVFLLAVSRSVAESFSSYANLDRDRITVISNAIDEGFFRVFPERGRNAPQGILAVGRLCPEKNHALILKAMARIPGPTRPTLHLYGQGPLRDRLAELAGRWDVGLRLEGLDPYLQRVFRKHQFFINASKIEGQALVLLEALAQGVPCLLSDIPPHREVAGNAALYFSHDSPSACAVAIRRLCQDGVLRARLATAGRKKAGIARPKFVAAKLFRYYRKVLAGKVKPAE